MNDSDLALVLIQSVEGCRVLTWERPQRKSVNGCLHILDLLDADALRLEQLNALIDRVSKMTRFTGADSG